MQWSCNEDRLAAAALDQQPETDSHDRTPLASASRRKETTFGSVFGSVKSPTQDKEPLSHVVNVTTAPKMNASNTAPRLPQVRRHDRLPWRRQRMRRAEEKCHAQRRGNRERIGRQLAEKPPQARILLQQKQERQDQPTISRLALRRDPSLPSLL
jgi:hypothetical protein